MTCRFSLLILGLAIGGEVAAGGESTPAAKQRIPWTTSRIMGAPDPPPPYQVRQSFPNLQFTKPVCLTNAPGSERLFVAEQGGKIVSFVNDPDCRQSDLVVDLKASHDTLGSVYGLAFHPQFAQNRQVFVCYTVGPDKPQGTRLVRFTTRDGEGPPEIDPRTERLILTWPSGGHNGGCVKFGPDGYLYVTAGDGDGPSPPDTKLVGQDVTNLLSTVFRIDIDQAGDGQAYGVPSDNPFVELDAARAEIWAYGFRNPWKMSFDRQTGDLWVGDVGWELWEMVYRVKRGGNYGWSITEGRQSVLPEQPPGPTPILPPTIDHPHSEAGSITGGFVYRGNRLPELQGVYVYGDYQSGIVWGAHVRGDEVAGPDELARTPLQLVGFGEDHAGELYLLDYRGQIYQLWEHQAEPRSEQFPRTLSETGLFSSVARHTPADGVVPYSINAEHWADGTTAERWLAVPGAGQIQINDEGSWQFPDGSVIAKTVSMDNVVVGETRPDGKTVRLETQILHRENGSWRPYTYVWDETQTDAVLAQADGFTRELSIRDESLPGGFRKQRYRFASRNECSLCHNPWVEARTTIFGVQSASPLGVDVKQLNRDHQYAEGTANQLQELAVLGILDADFDLLSSKTDRLANPYDKAANLAARARAYLHVNCAHCHQFNAGGAATIALSHDVDLAEAKLLDVRPTQGTFHLSDARIIAPGDPYGSVLFYRMAKQGGGRMPRVGSREVDQRGLELMYRWIVSLAPRAARGLPADTVAALHTVKTSDSAEVRAASIQHLVSSTRDAVALALLMSREPLEPAARRQILDSAKQHPAVEIRDLFERFLPASERIQRLGEVVNQAELLALEADAARGKQVFFNNSAAACKNCHQIGQVGVPLGPDLTAIGKKYRKDQLLQQILEPSRFLEPKYVPYLLETAQGLVLTGLVVEQTDKQVVLLDAKNQRHVIPADEVELLVRQQKSLMPELLLRDLTPQEVADLLAYLAALK